MAEPCNSVLAPKKTNVRPELWTPGNGREAEFGALVIASIFPDIDEQWAQDMLKAQQEAMGEEWRIDTLAGESMTVGVTIGAEDNNRVILDPARAIDGYNALTQCNGETVPEAHCWDEMYNNRTPSWWNRRRPDDKPSQIVTEPFVLGVLSDLLDTNKTWQEQQGALNARIITTTTNTATEAVTPMDMLMRDAAAIVSGATLEKPRLGIGRLNTSTIARFVQHDQQDIIGFSAACGPGSLVRGGLFCLDGSNGLRSSSSGLRVLRGQRAPEA